MGNVSDEDLQAIREQAMAATKIQAIMRGKQTRSNPGPPQPGSKPATPNPSPPKPAEEAKPAEPAATAAAPAAEPPKPAEEPKPSAPAAPEANVAKKLDMDAAEDAADDGFAAAKAPEEKAQPEKPKSAKEKKDDEAAMLAAFAASLGD